MRKPTGAMESALMKSSNAIPGAPGQNAATANWQPQAGQQNAMQSKPAQPQAQAGNTPGNFYDVVEELQQLVLEGKLPAGLDLQQLCLDQTFADLIARFPAEAALRVYIAESRAEEAENRAMQQVNDRVRSRNALPRSARGGAMSAPAPNYRDMDDATFRRVLAEMKKAARDGKNVTL